MNSKTLLMVCLMAGFSVTQLSAQNSNPTDTKSYQGWYVETSYSTPAYCGDQLVEILEGVVIVHWVGHVKEGWHIWRTLSMKGEATSQTGEVFRVSDKGKWFFTDSWYFTSHYNLIGDRVLTIYAPLHGASRLMK
jgi:hypothetical protein